MRPIVINISAVGTDLAIMDRVQQEFHVSYSIEDISSAAYLLETTSTPTLATGESKEDYSNRADWRAVTGAATSGDDQGTIDYHVVAIRFSVSVGTAELILLQGNV